MNNLKVKTVTIEADTREEAAIELRKQLGDGVPQEIIDNILSRAFDKGEREGAEFVPAAKQEKANPLTPEGLADIKVRTLAQAKRISELAPEQQHDALTQLVIELGAAFGFSPEYALARANESKDKTNALLEMLGVELPDTLKRPFGTKPSPEQPKPRETRKAEALSAAYGETPDRKRISDNFDKAIAAIKAAGYSDQSICHIGQHYKMQDSVVDAMQYLYHLGGYDGEHKHVPSAKLYMELDNYLKHANEFVYAVCNRAGVNPEVFGFLSENEWRSNYDDLSDFRNDVSRTIEASRTKQSTEA